MSLLWSRGATRRAGAAERRSLSFQDVYGTGGDVDLIGPGAESALRLVPLFSAHRTIIDAVCSTPAYSYERRADGTTARVAEQPRLLTTPLRGTPFGWKAEAVASLLSDGNAFGLPTLRDRFGFVEQLVWLDPYKVSIDDSRPEAPIYYWQARRLDASEIVHVPWIVPPGKVRGLSPLKAFRTAFEMGQSALQSGRDWFVNGAIPSGHLKSTERLTAEAAEKAKRRFRSAVAGRDVLVTGDDWSYTTIGVPADEARFIEAMKLSAAQIASIYGLRPEDIGGEANGPSLEYKTLEQDERRENARVVRPWAIRLEEALSALRPPGEFVEFDLDARVRADLKTRMEAHEIALRAGLEFLDEARLSENKPLPTPEQLQQWKETHGAKRAPQPIGAPAPDPKGQQA